MDEISPWSDNTHLVQKKLLMGNLLPAIGDTTVKAHSN